MAKPISQLTYKIVAFLEIQQVDTNESIDWAIEMMELGYESPTLYMLASFNKPTNYSEVINYVTDTVEELGLEMKSGDSATLSYTSYYVHQIAKGQRVRENLTELYKFCQMRDYEDLVYDFYLLYWAWVSLDYEDHTYNHYWDGARKENIKTIVMDEAKKWLKKNKEHYEQH
tara:strand:- start:187805 stop:188320 length:516 start_codon:yes stop_codon:yes gene_type:complete